MPRPVVASYCATFLTPEMLHIYRQITALHEFQPHVITQKWLNSKRFPMPGDRVSVVRKSRARAVRKFWFKQLLDRPILVSEGQAEEILDEIAQIKADLLHVYFGHIGVYLLPVLRRLSLPIVVSFHGADAGVDVRKPWHQDSMEEVFQRSARILARSESLAAELIELGCPAGKIALNRTGIPLEEWPFRARMPPIGDRWRLFQACRLIEKKGLDLSIRAFAQISKKYPESELRIAGEGPLLEPMQQLAEKFGVADRVQFLGFLSQDELKDEIRKAHVFLHPSRTATDGNREGVPNSMLEAMATGLPVAATRHGGIPEAIENGQNGLLVEEEDWQGLAQRVLQLLKKPSLYGAIAEGARKGVERQFDQEAQIAALEEVYRSVL